MPKNLGRYEVRAKIAEGGMAVVYLGRLAGPAGFERVVALKVIRDQYALNPDFARMFLDEAKIVARLSHPNIVQVHELGMEGKRLFIAMELLHGQSLWHVWDACQARKVRLRYDLACWLCARIAEGLHHAHEIVDPMTGNRLDVVHRDVNPSNIFITYDGQPKVIDFGLAKAVGRMEETKVGVIKGKLAYMSPEQAKGKKVDRRTDVFALGATLWELTVDRRLFKRGSDTETLRAVIEQPIPDPSTLVMGYPPRLWQVLQRALAKDANQRYASALDFARELDQCSQLEGRVVTNASMAEVMLSLFAHEVDRQAKWIAEASSAIGPAPREAMRPSAGTPPAAAGVPHRPGVFAESDPDAPTLYYVPRADAPKLQPAPIAPPSGAPSSAKPSSGAPSSGAPSSGAPSAAPSSPRGFDPSVRVAVAAHTAPAQNNRALWIAIGVLSTLLLGVAGALGYVLMRAR